MKPVMHIEIKIELGKDDSTEAISDLVSLVREQWKQSDIAVQVGCFLKLYKYPGRLFVKVI